jgi:hypothetical protein
MNKDSSPEKDSRFEMVKRLIESNGITEFREIFITIPKTVFAHELSKNTGRMGDLIDDAEKLNAKEMYRIGELLDVNVHAILDLVITQYRRKIENEDFVP